MTQLQFALMILVLVVLAIIYIKYKRSTADADNSWNSGTNSKSQTAQLSQQLVFTSNAEREKFLEEIIKPEGAVIIAWFDSDKRYLTTLYETKRPEFKIYLHSAFDKYKINADIPIILWGWHPMASTQDKLLQAIDTHTLVSSMSSMEDEQMRQVGGENLASLMRKLGHKQGDALEHPMISSSIRRAQENFECTVIRPVSASSASEWFNLNLKT